jgi:formylmethanofuran dehydrogenase subunit E
MSKVAKGRKQYVSMRGKPVDIDLLRKKNELTPAVGNARVNARGDELGPGGKIVRKREEIIREYYDKNPSKVPNEKSKKKPDPIIVKEELSTEEAELFEVVEADDEWIEDAKGNFVKKGE